MQVLEQMISTYEINSYLVGMYIKLTALMADTSDPGQIQALGKMFKKFAYAD